MKLAMAFFSIALALPAYAGLGQRRGLWRPGTTIRINVLKSTPADIACLRNAAEVYRGIVPVTFQFNARPPGLRQRLGSFADQVTLTVRRPEHSRDYLGHSYVGNMTFFKEAMMVTLDPQACNAAGRRIIVHELGHLLGLHHEHQHPDVPAFITLQYQWNMNAPADQLNPIARGSDLARAMYITPYDVLSVMHYEFIYGPAQAALFTEDLLPLSQGTMFLANSTLSEGDVALLREMY
jgi:hypothetical protein